MKAIAIIHVDFEKPALIAEWLKMKKIDLKIVKAEDELDLESEYDFLIIMGGPMNIYEYEKYPWLKKEKEFIKNGIKNNKKVLGVCLGAQLIADVLGGKVKANNEKEIGWFDIEKTNKENEMTKGTDNIFKVLHWHGDTFEIPNGAKQVYKSKACENQAFVYKNNVLALQFHMEMLEENIQAILKNCANEIIDGKWIQDISEIELFTTMYMENCKKNLYILLENLFNKEK